MHLPTLEGRAFAFALPTTGALFFPALNDADLTIERVIQQANTQRGVLRDTLKSLKRASEKDMLSVIRVCQDYLPLLHQLHTLSQYKSLIVNWRSMYSHHRLPNKDLPRLDFTGLSYELLFVLLTYGQALYNDALVQEDDARASETFCQATGVFEYISGQICAEVSPGSCPETYPALSSALAKLSLAHAQLRAASSIRGKTSNAILCRIAIAAGDLAASSIGQLSAHPMRKVIPGDVLEHMTSVKGLAMARAYVCLALDAQKQGRIGFAVACATIACKLDGSKEEMATLLSELTKENDQVTFQAVPEAAEVHRQLPSGRDLCKAKPYRAPAEPGQESGDRLAYAGDGSYY